MVLYNISELNARGGVDCGYLFLVNATESYWIGWLLLSDCIKSATQINAVGHLTPLPQHINT